MPPAPSVLVSHAGSLLSSLDVVLLLFTGWHPTTSPFFSFLLASFPLLSTTTHFLSHSMFSIHLSWILTILKALTAQSYSRRLIPLIPPACDLLSIFEQKLFSDCSLHTKSGTHIWITHQKCNIYEVPSGAAESVLEHHIVCIKLDRFWKLASRWVAAGFVNRSKTHRDLWAAGAIRLLLGDKMDSTIGTDSH